MARRRNFFERDDPPRTIVRAGKLGGVVGRVTYCAHRDYTFHGTDWTKMRERVRRVAARVAELGCYDPGCFRNGGHV